jgi:hypothetical protein
MNKPNYFVAGIAVALLGGSILYYQLFFLLARFPPPKGFAGNAAVIEHKISRASEMRGPKLLLVGGSSVGSGISAKTLNSKLGISTFNFSFWGSLGASYILHLAKKVLKPGDTVLLCLEYEILDWRGPTNYWSDVDFIRFIIGFEPDYIEGKDFFEKAWLAFSAPPRIMLNGFIRKRESIHFDSLENHNLYGDSINNSMENKIKELEHYENQIKQKSSAYMSGFQCEPKGAKAVHQFLSWAKKNQIQVIATYPNLAHNKEYTDEQSDVVEKQIQKMYAEFEIPVLGSPEDSILPEVLFYDTNYHLLEKSTIQKTKRLINEIQDYRLENKIKF